jgi:hypothetical protein
MFDLLTYLEGCESLLSFSTVRAKLDMSKRTLRKMVAERAPTIDAAPSFDTPGRAK